MTSRLDKRHEVHSGSWIAEPHAVIAERVIWNPSEAASYFSATGMTPTGVPAELLAGRHERTQY
ncbi:MAG: hypothetical protein JSV65_05095, partial [Armatimonadota bacterium]